MSVTPNSSFLGKVSNLSGPLTSVNSSEGNFSQVDTTNSSITTLTATTGTVTTLTATTGTVTNLTTNQGSITETTVTGFAPTTFATASAGSYTLNSTPGAAASASPVQLPAGAVITRVTLDNNGTTVTSGGSATVAITVGALNGSASVTPVAATALSVVNTGGSVTASGAAVGDAATQVAASLVPAAPNNYLNATVAVAALTAGNLRVKVSYYLPG